MSGLDTFTIALVVFAVAVAALALGMYGRTGMLKGCCGWLAGFRGSRSGHGGESPPGTSDQALRECLERGACGPAGGPADKDEPADQHQDPVHPHAGASPPAGSHR